MLVLCQLTAVNNFLLLFIISVDIGYLIVHAHLLYFYI